MSLNRYAVARDRNELEIIDELLARGCLVERLSGAALPDLLVGFRQRWVLLEVKAPNGKLTAAQVRWHHTARDHGLPVHVVRSSKQACDALGLRWD